MSDDSARSVDSPPNVSPPAEPTEAVRHVSEGEFQPDAAQDADGRQAPGPLMPTTPPGPVDGTGLGAQGTVAQATTGGETLQALSPRDRRLYEAWQLTGFHPHRLAESAERAGMPFRSKGALTLAHQRLRPHVDAYWSDSQLGESELAGLLAETARLDPAALGQCYADEVLASGATVRRFDWEKARELGVSRFVAKVTRDRNGNDNAEWLDVHAARALLARVLGLTSDGTTVNVDMRSLSIDELRTLADG